MSADTSTQQRQPPKFMNKVLAFLMRTPLHSIMSQHIMLITFRGRKSGKLFTTPIGYLRQGESVSCFTDHKWWRNLVEQPEVTLLIRGKRYQGKAEVIHDDKEAIASALIEYCTHSPMAAQAFRVELDANKRPITASAHEQAQRLTLLRVQLS